jgi:Kef-type K+ transport system membrane component KefB
MRLIRQPLILGYILSGLLVGPALFGLINSNEMFDLFADIGIALLLFVIGIGLNVAVIKKLGKTVFLTALASLVSVGSLGFLASIALGYTSMEALIVALALFFSSTIIIVKVLNDKKEQNRLHGQIAIGVILFDDIVATLALVFIAAGRGGGFAMTELAFLIGKGVLLFLLLAFISTKIFPHISKFMASSQEMLFLFAIAWGFGVASLFDFSGFSIEVGALFAGVALASLPYAQQIEARLKPLRDFFVVVFFIVMGSSLTISNLSSALLPALILSAIVMLIKPVVTIATLSALGYPKRVGFKTGINLSQISEFSIVMVVLATEAKLVPVELSAVITLVAIITIALSTYLMKYDNQLFAMFDRFKIQFLDRPSTRTENHRSGKYSLVLFGYQKGGHEFVRAFREMHKKFVVVDYDPDVIEVLQQQQVPYFYGDASDLDLLDELGLHTTELVVSAMSDFETNQQLVKYLNLHSPETAVICSASDYEQALQLYELGCSYVIIPHFIGSQNISTFIRKNGLSRDEFQRYREKHLSYLEAHRPITLSEEAV